MKKFGLLKNNIPDLIAIAAFIIISFVYFAPAVIDGRVITQHDSLAAIGQGQEQRDYMERHDGQRSRWNLSMFCGMPTYQMSPTYRSTYPQDVAKKVYRLFLPDYVFLVFIMLMGFYILMRAFKASPLISALGAIAWAFSSYFFIIIAAGHIWKFITLAYIPPTIAGLVYIYRKKYVVGAFLFMLFVAFQISSNHFQMSYYFGFVMLFMVLAYLAEAIKHKKVPEFMKSTAVLLVAGLIGVAANASSLYHTYEYSKETMRGKSELSHHGAENKSSNGLERDYITAWSYGKGETWTLLIPNTKGGASVPLSENKTAMKKARPEYRQLYQQIGQYWGEQPGTSGPVYVGAFVLTLFILGLFIVKGPIKWALFTATVFSILLSWGKNFMGLTDFFIDHVPMYNKFRAVSSILVIAEFCIPLLAALAIKELVSHRENAKEHFKYLAISVGITAGFSLLFFLFPKLFFSSFISSSEAQALQSFPSEHIQAITANLTSMRVAMFTADAWRSFYIIIIGALLTGAIIQKKFKSKWLVSGILILCLGDMWSVNKRYLNDSDFTSKTSRTQPFTASQTDAMILQDSTAYYRVLNMATSTFNDGITPYWHKCLGGYHAAKLRRYQDMIEVHLSKEMGALQQEIVRAQGNMDSLHADQFKVLNMLNTKWIIMPTQSGTVPIENPYAMGNAWYVDNVKMTTSPDEEIDAVGEVDLHKTAIIDKDDAALVAGKFTEEKNALSTIELVDYDSDFISYSANAQKDELAVFSEIYYPHGWRVTIDGNPAKMIRANYTLRALPIPAGKHRIEFHFNPKSITITDTIAYIALVLIALMALFAIWKKYQSMASGKKSP